MTGIPIHGHSIKPPTPTYNSWRNMVARCTRNNHHRWNEYGGRGIVVCTRWMEFRNFLADMGERPKGTTLERVNNNIGYEPSNCRWATAYEQNRNSRHNVLLTFRGETKLLIDWARSLGIKQQTLTRRILSGWSTERALSQPVGRSR